MAMEQLHSLSALDDEGLLTRLGRRVSNCTCTHTHYTRTLHTHYTHTTRTRTHTHTTHTHYTHTHYTHTHTTHTHNRVSCLCRWQSSPWNHSCVRCWFRVYTWDVVMKYSPLCQCYQCRMSSTDLRYVCNNIVEVNPREWFVVAFIKFTEQKRIVWIITLPLFHPLSLWT